MFLMCLLFAFVCYLTGMSGLDWNFSLPIFYHITSIGVGAVSILTLWLVCMVCCVVWDFVWNLYLKKFKNRF